MNDLFVKVRPLIILKIVYICIFSRLSEYYLTVFKCLVAGVTGLGTDGDGPVLQENATPGASKI